MVLHQNSVTLWNLTVTRKNIHTKKRAVSCGFFRLLKKCLIMTFYAGKSLPDFLKAMRHVPCCWLAVQRFGCLKTHNWKRLLSSWAFIFWISLPNLQPKEWNTKTAEFAAFWRTAEFKACSPKPCRILKNAIVIFPLFPTPCSNFLKRLIK